MHVKGLKEAVANVMGESTGYDICAWMDITLEALPTYEKEEINQTTKYTDIWAMLN